MGGSYGSDEEQVVRECANCGGVEGLLRCSRCRQVWFCSLKCQKAYWPVHKPECRSNEFPDAVEEKEPKFAAWLRQHGKQAVLKDEEVDRLERAAKAAQGPSREEVMDSMYGRVAPKPKEPSYTAEEKRRMQLREDQEALEARQRTSREKAWAALTPDPELGKDCGDLKWQQDQSHVEIFCRIPDNVPTSEVEVKLLPSSISIAIATRALLTGPLWAGIKLDGSTWWIDDGGMLVVTLLKANRRGSYQDGSTNAHTFWRSLLKSEPAGLTLEAEKAPLCYYSSHWEAPEGRPPARVGGKRPARLAPA